MIHVNQSLPCPTCNGNIQIDVKQLLEGTAFHCPNCMSVIRISTEAKDIIKNIKLPEGPGRSGGKK